MPKFRLAIGQACLLLVALASLSSSCWQVVVASKSDHHKLIMPTMVTVVEEIPLMNMKSPVDSSSHGAKMNPIIEMVALSEKADVGKELLESRLDDGDDDLSTLAGHKKYVLVKKKPKHKKIKMEVYKPKMKYKKIKIKVPVKKMKKKKVKGYMIKKEHDHYA